MNRWINESIAFPLLPPFLPALAERDFARVYAHARIAHGLCVARAQGTPHVAPRPHQLVDESLPPLFRDVRVGRAPAAAINQYMMPIGGFLNPFLPSGS